MPRKGEAKLSAKISGGINRGVMADLSPPSSPEFKHGSAGPQTAITVSFCVGTFHPKLIKTNLYRFLSTLFLSRRIFLSISLSTECVARQSNYHGRGVITKPWGRTLTVGVEAAVPSFLHDQRSKHSRRGIYAATQNSRAKLRTRRHAVERARHGGRRGGGAKRWLFPLCRYALPRSSAPLEHSKFV